jgi:hypothetical protein
MQRTKKDVKEAVEALLCPRHYEYLLFIQSEMESEKELAWRERRKQAREVIKIVHAEVPLLPAFSVDEAIHVLKEAVHRLK